MEKSTVNFIALVFFVLTALVFVGCQTTVEKSEKVAQEVETTIDIPKFAFQPNILWLVTEDLGPYIPPFGDSTIVTPTLSRLADEGVIYTNVYSPSGVCAPSRFAIATGVYPASAGADNMRTQYGAQLLEDVGLILYEVVTPPEVKMMSEVMRRNGYYCTNNAKTDYQFAPMVTGWDESTDKAHWRNRPEGKPFFSVFNFEVTHESRMWTKAKDSLWVSDDLEVPVPPYLPNTKVAKSNIRRMYSNIKEMDAQVGERLRQLEEDGLLDSTIVVWYGDHGGPLPRQKRLLYDGGMNTPMIIRYPEKLFAGAVDDQLISFVDFAPTTFSLANIPLPSYLQGQAFAGAAKPATERKYVYGAADRLDNKYDMIRAVRDRRFKYLHNYKPEQGYYLEIGYRENMPIMKELLRLRDKDSLTEYQAQWFRNSKPKEELFDCENDQHELVNLAEDPKYKDKLMELRAENDRFMKAVGDKGFVPEKELLSQFWPGWKQPQTEKPTIAEKNGKVELTTATVGGSIGYQILKSDEKEGKNWAVYTEPLTLSEGEKLVVVADRIGFKPSDIVVFEPEK